MIKLNKLKKSLREENEEYDLGSSSQEYSSAKTSINSSKLPALFGMVNFQRDTINLDYGGGKFDNVTEFLSTKGVTNYTYDKYNRTTDYNRNSIRAIKENSGADTVTCSNVLNVIKEPEERTMVIKNIYALLKQGGTAYFTVYEGSGKGDEGVTSAGYQLNKKTPEYMEEIMQVFKNVSRKGKLIVAKK